MLFLWQGGALNDSYIFDEIKALTLSRLTGMDDLYSTVLRDPPSYQPHKIGDLKLLAPSANCLPITEYDRRPICDLGMRPIGPAESGAAQRVEVDFVAQPTSGHDLGCGVSDWAALSLRTLGSPQHVITSKI